MHPLVNSFGAGPGFPGAEEIWDHVLSRGAILWGIASDDVHQLKESWGRTDPGRGAQPGRGWIMVRAAHLTADEIMQAIENGDFYAWTGVVLEDYQCSTKEIKITLPPSGKFKTKYGIQLIAKKGRIVQDSIGNEATYRIRGNEGYVRARITDSNGKATWTQPVWISRH